MGFYHFQKLAGVYCKDQRSKERTLWNTITHVEAIWVTAINKYTLGSGFKVESEPLQSSARYPETRLIYKYLDEFKTL